jgi:hypothetical protein
VLHPHNFAVVPILSYYFLTLLNLQHFEFVQWNQAGQNVQVHSFTKARSAIDKLQVIQTSVLTGVFTFILPSTRINVHHLAQAVDITYLSHNQVDLQLQNEYVCVLVIATLPPTLW